MSKLTVGTRSELEGLRADAPSEAVPALDAGILQSVRELGRHPVEYKSPANEEQQRDSALAQRIRRSMPKHGTAPP